MFVAVADIRYTWKFVEWKRCLRIIGGVSICARLTTRIQGIFFSSILAQKRFSSIIPLKPHREMSIEFSSWLIDRDNQETDDVNGFGLERDR